MRLTLDLAIIRYSVICESWQRLSPGFTPVLGAFLAGWFCRDMGSKADESVAGGRFRDSWRAGWTEADSQLAIDDAQRTRSDR